MRAMHGIGKGWQGVGMDRHRVAMAVNRLAAQGKGKEGAKGIASNRKEQRREGMAMMASYRHAAELP